MSRNDSLCNTNGTGTKHWPFYLVIVVTYAAIIVFTAVVLSLVVAASTVHGTIRFVLANILIASITACFGIPLICLRALLITSNPHLFSSTDVSFQIFLAIMAIGGNGRSAFMAVFAVVVVVIMKCSNSAVDSLKTMWQFSHFLLLGNGLGFFGNSIAIAGSLIFKSANTGHEVARVLRLVFNILLVLSLIPTPILILVYFKPVCIKLRKCVLRVCGKWCRSHLLPSKQDLMTDMMLALPAVDNDCMRIALGYRRRLVLSKQDPMTEMMLADGRDVCNSVLLEMAFIK